MLFLKWGKVQSFHYQRRYFVLEGGNHLNCRNRNPWLHDFVIFSAISRRVHSLDLVMWKSLLELRDGTENVTIGDVSKYLDFVGAGGKLLRF